MKWLSFEEATQELERYGYTHSEAKFILQTRSIEERHKMIKAVQDRIKRREYGARR